MALVTPPLGAPQLAASKASGFSQKGTGGRFHKGSAKYLLLHIDEPSFRFSHRYKYDLMCHISLFGGEMPNNYFSLRRTPSLFFGEGIFAGKSLLSMTNASM
jgi:hypothetical protein